MNAKKTGMKEQKKTKINERRIRKVIANHDSKFQVATLHKILSGNSISLPNNATVLYAILKT